MLRVFGAGVYPGITESEDEDTSIQVTPTPNEPSFEKASLKWCRGNSKYGRTQ
jgi:hypothetical protein